MRLESASLLLAAFLAVPGFGQAVIPESQAPPPYAVSLSYGFVAAAALPGPGTGGGDGSVFLPDVEDVAGLPVDRILANGSGSSPRSGALALVRNWDGETLLSDDVGKDGGPTSFLAISQNQPQVVQLPLLLRLNHPVICSWTLLAQQGLFITESVRLTYSGWSVQSQPGIPR